MLGAFILAVPRVHDGRCFCGMFGEMPRFCADRSQAQRFNTEKEAQRTLNVLEESGLICFSLAVEPIVQPDI